MLVLRFYFIQCVPWSFIQTVTQKQKVVDSSGNCEKRVASRYKQHQEGEWNRLEHPDSQGVGFHVVDGDEGFTVLPHKPLAEVEANTQAQGQTWLHSSSNSRQLPRVHLAPLQGLLDYTVDIVSVELLCDGGDDAATSKLFRTEYNTGMSKKHIFVCVLNILHNFAHIFVLKFQVT